MKTEKPIWGPYFLMGSPQYDKGRLYLYVLVDPRDGWVRYAGVTASPQKRLESHVSQSTNPGIIAWCRELHPLRPILQVVGRTTLDGWQKAERRWISHLRKWGPSLNRDYGGRASTWWAQPALKREAKKRQENMPRRKKKKKHKRGKINQFGIYKQA